MKRGASLIEREETGERGLLFSMIGSLREALAGATGSLAAAGVESPPLEARLLLAHALRITPERVILESERRLSAPEREGFGALVARRCAREPLAYITGEREFWGLPFAVTPATLIPRPDSETLVEAVLSYWRSGASPPGGAQPAPLNAASRRCAPPAPTILDLGTGTGCLLLSLLSELPQSSGMGVDISPDATAVAQENARRLGFAERAVFRQGKWGDGLTKSFDIVVSNPPYIGAGALGALGPEIRLHEPRLALEAGEDGLACYREIAAGLSGWLAPEGLVALEMGAGQAEAVGRIFGDAGFAVISAHRDLSGITRCLLLRRA